MIWNNIYHMINNNRNVERNKNVYTIMFLEEWTFEITDEITYDDNSIISEKRKNKNSKDYSM